MVREHRGHVCLHNRRDEAPERTTRMDTSKRPPRETPTDPMRLARRVQQVLGWHYDFSTQQFVGTEGPVPSDLVEPMLSKFLKTEIDNAPIRNARGRAAALYVDIIPAHVLAALKAMAL
jgi:hypothetical protein